jgi:hypothetical protein
VILTARIAGQSWKVSVKRLKSADFDVSGGVISRAYWHVKYSSEEEFETFQESATDDLLFRAI